MVTAETLEQVANEALNTGDFPRNLKKSRCCTCFKKKNPLGKENDRLVSVLPIFQSVQKLMQNQINLHIKSFLLPTCVVKERVLIVNML